jgi:hypothetical protein
MTNPTSGGTPDPYQPQQPYGQPYDPTAPYQAAPGGQPAYGQPPAGGQPPIGQPPTGAPSAEQPASGQPSYGQPPAYPQAPFGAQPGYEAQPGYGAPGYGVPGYGAQGYGAQPGYGAPPYQPPMYATASTNTLAILALVFAFIFAPASIVLGHLAKRQIRQTGEQGEGLATAGLWLGYIFTSLGLLACIAYAAIILFAIGNAASSGTTTF